MTFAPECSACLFDKMPIQTYFDLFDKDGKEQFIKELPLLPLKDLPLKDIAPNIIEVTCKTLTGARIVIHIDDAKTIFNLKQYIYKKTDIMLDDQRLVFNGKVLDDTDTIKSCNVKNGDSVNMICRLRGGMFHSSSSRADFVSLNFTNKFQKGSKMVHGLKQYNIHLDTLAELEKRLQQCETDLEIDKIYALIESVYLA